MTLSSSNKDDIVTLSHVQKLKEFVTVNCILQKNVGGRPSGRTETILYGNLGLHKEMKSAVVTTGYMYFFSLII